MKFLKNLHLVALFAAMIALNAQAAPVTSSEQVRCAVSAWSSANGSAFADIGKAVSAEVVAENGTNLYWIVRMSGGGAVIASPDTDLDLVVAVLEKFDGFPAGHPLPSILRRDMLKRLSVIGSASSATASASSSGISLLSASSSSSSASSSGSASLSAAVKSAVSAANAQWSKYIARGRAVSALSLAGGDDSPYVRRIVPGFEDGGVLTHWNQSRDVSGENCYNSKTPYNEVCGCVATAGAAILQFFGCAETPAGVEGEACKVYGNAYACSTIGGEIDWTILSTNYGGTAEMDGLDAAGRDLLGRITYDIGVLVNMSWAGDGAGTESGAYISDLPAAFKACGFATSRYVSFVADEEEGAQFYKMVYAQNWAGAPVVLGIVNTADEAGHAVIACGYAKTADEEDYCRVFMGWGGYCDAWYRFPAIDEFNVIDGAVTMIGYADNLVVPVCGRANVTDTELEFPGATYTVGEGEEAMEVTLTAPVDSNGFFAVRVPFNMSDATVSHAASDTERMISPFDPDVLSDEAAGRAALEAAMPGEMAFLVLNTELKPTVESGRAKAAETGKALLMISGAGSNRENALVDYITYLDSTTDMSNKFVIVRVNSSDVTYADGDPSIGVFDPLYGASDLRWWIENGRLEYDNFIVGSDDDTGSLQYTFSAMDTTALTNAVDLVVDRGYDTYLRRNSGITVTVSGVDMADVTVPVGSGDPAYGTHTGCWTNGEEVVFSAPAEYTNETAGIVYVCSGWTTNSLDDAESFEKGNSVALRLSSGDEIPLVWLWKVSAYRVSTATDPEGEPALTPGTAWIYPGDRVTVVSTNSLKNGAYNLAGWEITCVSGAAYDTEAAVACINGSALSFTVLSPVNVLATYSRTASAPADPEEFEIDIAVNPPELADFVSDAGTLGLGSNATYDPMASLVAQATEIVDSTGGVWKCVGWVQGGVTNDVSALVSLSSGEATSVELVWELQEPEIELPEPTEFSFKSIEKTATGSWRITVTGAVEGCWYWLYSASDPSALADGTLATQGVFVSKTQAGADGEVSFETEASGDRLFWRVLATSTEEGGE